MGYTRNTGQLSYLITYDGSGNITVPASFTQTTVTSSMLKADSAGKLVAAVAGTDFVAPAGLSAYVPTTRTITINGTTFDLSADRSWSIVSGVSSFNTRTGAITLSSSDVTTALGYTPYNSTNPSGYLTTSTVLNTVLTPYTVGANTAVTATDTIETAIEKLQGQVNARVPNTRTITINGTSFDLSADRSWTIVSGVSSFNTRTGAITLTSGDVTTALGYTPVTNARTITINGTAYDLSADRTWVVDASSVSTRVLQKFTATSGQTTFTVTGGYTVGMVDVFLNGVKLDNATEFTASNGSTVVLTSAAVVNDVVEVYKYGGQFIANNTLRQTTAFTATAGQTTFTVNYSVGFVDVFYNGAKLAASEFTATNGTSIVLGTACVVGDIVEVIAYNYTVGAFTGVGGSGTTNYIPKWTASGTLGNSLIFDNGTSIGIGTSNPSGAAGLALVLNSGTSQGRICIKTSSTGDTSGAGLQIVMSGVDASIEQRENAALTFATNASERLRITSSGNVGIGTTNPNSILEIKTSTATNSIRLGVIANDNTFNMISLNGTNTEGQYVGLAGGGGTDTNLFYQSGNGGDHRFRTGNGTSYTERLRITNTGNVGIGTTSPGSRFDVRVISGDSNQMRISADTNTYKDMQWYDTTNGRMWILSHRIGSDGNKLMAWYNNGTSYNSSPALTIDTNNNVGINTSNPSRRLHISASVSGVFEGILVENTASSSYSLYQCKTGSSSVWQWGVWNDNGYRVGISGVGDFLLMNTNGQIRLPNQPSFKYGIGSKTITSVTRFGTDWGFGVLTDRDTVDSSYFNKANGRFTAPVAGTYIFGCTIMRSGNTGTGPVDFQIVKNEPNPISQSSASTYGRGYVGSYSADYQQITITATIKLAVNDYIALDFSGNMSTYDDDSWFYGYFLG